MTFSKQDEPEARYYKLDREERDRERERDEREREKRERERREREREESEREKRERQVWVEAHLGIFSLGFRV